MPYAWANTTPKRESADWGISTTTQFVVRRLQIQRSAKKMRIGCTRAYYLFAFSFVSGSRCLPYHNKLNFNQMVLYGIDHKVGGVFASRLLKNIGAMLIHRTLRDK